MQKLRDFFALRPIFSARDLRTLWIAFLLTQLVPYGYFLYALIATRSPPYLGDWVQYATFFLVPAVHILFGRVLLELALVVLDLRPDWRRQRLT